VTAGAVVIGGAIPAAIAWRTFKYSSKQLKEDREEQKSMFREERIAQNESLEAERKLQLVIAEKNFNLQVLSTNRQAWINKVRDLISECCVLGESLFDANHRFYTARNNFDKASADVDDDGNVKSKSNFELAFEELNAASHAVDLVRSKIDLVLVKIRLMLNPNETDSRNIIICLMRLKCRGSELSSQEQTYTETYPKMRDDIEEIIYLTHICLKKEWERVKNGT